MPTSSWNSNNPQTTLEIDCIADNVTVSLVRCQPHPEIFWKDHSSTNELHSLMQRTNNSLAQVQQIDAITHTIHADSTHQIWEFGIQLCLLLPLALMIKQTLSYVACINENNRNIHEIETYFRKQSLVWAHQRMRINCIRQKNQLQTPNTTMRFLLGNSSRVLTGGLFLENGHMLMGGHPVAERIMTQHSGINQLD